MKPFHPNRNMDTIERTVPGGTVTEIERGDLLKIVDEGCATQRRLRKVSLEQRLDTIHRLGRQWERRISSGDLDRVAEALSSSTGYARSLMDIEMSLVSKVMDQKDIYRNLECLLIGGAASVDNFTGMGGGESIRHMPAGPALIVASGNSVIPTLIPTIISLVTGNATILKPSMANYDAVLEALAPLSGMEDEASKAMAAALTVTYLGHDSPGLEALLTQAHLGVVNFWGGGQGRDAVTAMVARNPWHPRLFVNGPLTGVAVIGTRHPPGSAEALARNMVLYDQQLCSSPTLALFIGDLSDALEFADDVAVALDRIGSGARIGVSDDHLFVLNSVRKVMLYQGAHVLASQDGENPWTLAVSERPALDQAVTSFPMFGIHARRRFLEIVVGSMDDVPAAVANMPHRNGFHGIDGVQTIGMAMDLKDSTALAEDLLDHGVFRIVPLEDMYMRGAAEPYDGIGLASLFTYAVYRRDSPLGEQR